MKLVQFWVPGIGQRTGLVRGTEVVDVCAPSLGLIKLMDFLSTAERERIPVEAVVDRGAQLSPATVYAYEDLDIPPAADRPHMLIPFEPPEVWACGVTYMKSAEFRDGEITEAKGMYDYVYSARRPEVFFKATASRCVGPNAAIGIRSDSRFTAPEPELALVLNSRADILGYTLANDVSAWDIERENPLYLPQSKVYSACCSLGPVFVTTDGLHDPQQLLLKCSIVRAGATVFEGTAGISQMRRSFEELIQCVTLHNPLPLGTAILTGTGIIVPSELPLQAGDVVEISSKGIGALRNTAVVLPVN